MDRASSPAFRAAPERAQSVRCDRASDRRRQQRIGELHRLRADHRVTLKDVAPAVKLLDTLGLIEVE